MKKIVLSVLFIIVVTFPILAQSKPIVGYDKVLWGSSVEDVRNAYNIGGDVELTATEDENIFQLIQKNVSESISSRYFMFNGGLLYRVAVFYNDGSDNILNTLKDLLAAKYGDMTSFNLERGNSMGSYTEYHTFFSKYAPDIDVEVVQRKYDDGYPLDIIYVRYTWKKFRDKYQASKLGL